MHFHFQVHKTLLRELRVKIIIKTKSMFTGEHTSEQDLRLGTFMPHEVCHDAKLPWEVVPEKWNMLASADGDYYGTVELYNIQIGKRKLDEMTEEEKEDSKITHLKYDFEFKIAGDWA